MMSTLLLLASVALADPAAETAPAPIDLSTTVPLERRQCISRLMVVSEVVAGSGLAMVGGAIVDGRGAGEFVAPLAVVGGSLSLGGLAMLLNLRPALRGDPAKTPQNC